MKREPLLTVAAVTAVATALLGLGVAFGLPVSDDQQAAILAAVAAVAPIVVGLIARRYVTPVADPRADDGTPLRPGVL